MEVQHRILPSEQEINLIVDIIKLITPVDQEGISSPNLLQAIAVAMSKFNEVRIGYEHPSSSTKPLMSADKSLINKDKPNQVSIKEVITYLLDEKIIYKYKQDRLVDGVGHTFAFTHYGLVKTERWVEIFDNEYNKVLETCIFLLQPTEQINNEGKYSEIYHVEGVKYRFTFTVGSRQEPTIEKSNLSE